MNTAGRLRAVSINLSANSPIKYVLEDGTVLDIAGTEVVPDLALTKEEGVKRVGPDTLVVRLRPRPDPTHVNGTAEPVPKKAIKIPRTGSG